jgi:hypothetical protein
MCYKRFDRSFSVEEKVATPATTSYGIDTNWYVDLGATDYITSDLDKLSVWDKYAGNDQVHTASSSGMEIQHIGNSILHTPSRDLILKTYSMSLLSTKILFLFIVSPMIIMYSLNFIHDIF